VKNDLSPAKIEDASEWLVRLRDENATAQDRVAFEAWLACDPVHEAAFARVAGAVGLVQSARAGLRERLEARGVAKRKRRALVAGGLAAAAASFAIAFLVATTPPTYRTAMGEQRTVSLSDGSYAELNTSTRLAVEFQNDERRIRLVEGEAIFDVAHDPDRPFIVEARGQSVRAIGTKFVVRVDPQALSVLVIEGVVAVESEGARDSNAAPRVVPRIVAGEKLEVAGEGPAVRALALPEIERRLAWRDGMLQFDGEPLSYAVAEVSRYSNVQFVVDDANIAQTPIWAYFRATDLSGFLNSLEQNVSTLTVHRTGNVVRITPRVAEVDR
jgi:transmembrane sensor